MVRGSEPQSGKKKNGQRGDRLIQETIGRDDCLSESVCCRPLLVSDISICAGYFQFDLTFNSLTSSVMSPLGVFEAHSNFNCRWSVLTELHSI